METPVIDNYPVKKWARPWAFEDWRAAVCGEFVGGAATLAHFYSLEWEPVDCHAYMLANRLLAKRKTGPKVRTVGLEEVQRRIALAAWKECNRLLTRQLSGDARQWVSSVQEQTEKAAGITVHRGAVAGQHV